MDPFPKEPDPLDVLMVNCANCERELLGESQLVWYARLKPQAQAKYPPICRRLGGRPYCPGCSLVGFRDPPPRALKGHGNAFHDDGASPYQENAIRQMEDMKNMEDGIG